MCDEECGRVDVFLVEAFTDYKRAFQRSSEKQPKPSRQQRAKFSRRLHGASQLALGIEARERLVESGWKVLLFPIFPPQIIFLYYYLLFSTQTCPGRCRPQSTNQTICISSKY